MKQVKVTEFRAHLPEYLRKAQNGETITLLSRERLVALRELARIGDIVSPVEAEWNAVHDRP